MKNKIQHSVIAGFTCFFLLLGLDNTNAQTLDDSSQTNINLACGTPTQLHVDYVSPTTSRLMWHSVMGATRYVIRLRPTGTNSWRMLVSINTIEMISGLLPNTQYEVKVRSDCGTVAGNYSPLFYFSSGSNASCGIPGSYFFTSGNITSGSSLIGWPFVSGAIGYNVQYRIRNTATWTQTSSTFNSLLLTGLSPLSVYEFRVQTVCSSDSSVYTAVGVFTTLIETCAAPDSLTATNISDTSATLSWDTVGCATGYVVYFHEAGTSTWQTDTLSQTQADRNNLLPGTSYEFSVRSIDSTGSLSSFSPNYSFTTTQIIACGVAGNLNTVQVTTGSANLEWDSVPGAVLYRIRFRVSGSSSWQTDSSITNNVTLSSLSSNTVYQFQVQAVCSTMDGVYSASETFHTNPVVSATLPVPDHIVICILENKAYSQIMSGNLAPHIQALANGSKTVVFDESYALTHPSQPNYIRLFSGSSQGVTNNNLPSSHFTTPNLARSLIDAGFTFATYSEGLPSTGYDGATSGSYARKHNPVANWMGTGSNQVSSTHNKPFSSFPSNFNLLPTLSIVVPDMVNSMHDGAATNSIPNGDDWVQANMLPYIQWAKTHNSLFILTFDEDDGNHVNHILTFFAGEMIVAGTNSQPINHYDLLRTIEEMYGLPFIGASANASAIHGCWTNGFRLANPLAGDSLNAGWKIFPNPAESMINLSYTLETSTEVVIYIYNDAGSLIEKIKPGTLKEGNHVQNLPLPNVKYPDGFYLMEVVYGEKKFSGKFQVVR